MQLILTIENGPQPEMSGTTWRCGREGGTLGRNPECDLVLSDPKRYTSSVHAEIEFGQDGFTLTDRSTNGTYHNSPKTLIGKNRSVPLNQGDKLFIGDFVLRVEVQDIDGAGAPAQPESVTPPRFDREDADLGFDSALDPDSGPDPDPDRGADSDAGRGEPGRERTDAGDDSRPWDDSEFSLPWDSEGTEPDADDAKRGDDDDEDRSFSQSPEREYFAAPAASSGGGDAIPDDWDDFLTGFHDPEKLRNSGEISAHADDDGSLPETENDSRSTPSEDSEPAFEPATGAAGRESANHDTAGDSDDSDGKPFADAEPDEHERFEPPPAQAPAPRPARDDERPSANAAPARAREPGAHAASTSQTPPASRSEASAESPLEAAQNRPGDASAGADQLQTAQSPGARPTPGAAHAPDDGIREILQVVTEGLMGLLQGRAEIKNEFRIAQTRFVQTENNPLKFSPDAHEALKRILADEKAPGFLTGKRAFEDAFDDVQAHQLAILSAVQRAIESAVGQFDPAQIEKKLERISPLSARTPGLKAAKCWNLFSMHYDEVASKMREDTRQLFLAEFAEAYEEACRAVAESKRKTES